MAAVRKLKAVPADPAPLPPLRRPLADAIEHVSLVKAQIAKIEGEIESAREKIRAATAAVEDAENAVKAAPALERRAKRAALQEAEESLQDWKDHLGELQVRRRGDAAGMATDFPKGFDASLAHAEMKVRDERAALLKSHPHVLALLSVHESLRNELAQVAENLRLIERIGALPEASKFWASFPPDYRPPKADAALVGWIEMLTTDRRRCNMDDTTQKTLWVSQPNCGPGVPASAWPIVVVRQCGDKQPEVTTTTDQDAALSG
jgi:hypothetical protein